MAPQPVAADRLPFRRPAGWNGTAQAFAVPVLFAQTPVEMVDAGDVLVLARLVAAVTATPAPALGGPPAAPASRPVAAAIAPNAGRSLVGALKPVLEAYGVSGHEDHPREVVRRLIAEQVAPWAAPRVDERGNLVVSFGAGGDRLVFVAHLDELGYEITAIRDDGTASIRGRGGMYDSLYEAHPVLVHTAAGPVPAVLAPRSGYLAAETSQPRSEDLALHFGVSTAAEVRALGVGQRDTATVRKALVPLAGSRVAGRSMDDRSGSTALLMALGRIDPAAVTAAVTFIWSVEEETGLAGAAFAASALRPRYAFAVDTFVSTDSPFDTKRLADVPLGSGAVLRAMDNGTSMPPAVIDRLVDLARRRKIPMTVGVTSGGTDASAFSRYGAIDAGLSWPGRYSHSPAEVTDLRDLEAVVALIMAVATERW
jgi:putative aminopeptidase FrvX